MAALQQSQSLTALWKEAPPAPPPDPFRLPVLPLAKNKSEPKLTSREGLNLVSTQWRRGWSRGGRRKRGLHVSTGSLPPAFGPGSSMTDVASASPTSPSSPVTPKSPKQKTSAMMPSSLFDGMSVSSYAPVFPSVTTPVPRVRANQPTSTAAPGGTSPTAAAGGAAAAAEGGAKPVAPVTEFTETLSARARLPSRERDAKLQESVFPDWLWNEPERARFFEPPPLPADDDVAKHAATYQELMKQVDPANPTVRPPELMFFLEHQMKFVPLVASLSPRRKTTFCERAHYRSVPAGTLLCRQGEVGEEFFMIVRGKAEVSVGGVGAIAVLRGGDSIGQVSLLRSIARNANITTLTPCSLLVLSLQDFMSILRTRIEKEIQNRARFLRGVSLFQNWSLSRLLQLAEAVQVDSFDDGDIVQEQGSPAYNVMIVQTGKILMRHMQSQSESNAWPTSKTGRRKRTTKSILHKDVSEILPMQVYGIELLVKQLPHPFRLVASGETIILKLSWRYLAQDAWTSSAGGAGPAFGEDGRPHTVDPALLAMKQVTVAAPPTGFNAGIDAVLHPFPPEECEKIMKRMIWAYDHQVSSLLHTAQDHHHPAGE